MVYERIIEAIREKPYLYDKSLSNYKNKDLKQQTFEDIAVMINENFCIQMSGVNIQGIWEDLVKEFKIELKAKLERPSGAADESISTSLYFEHLLFLTNHINKHRTVSSSLKESSKMDLSGNASASIWHNNKIYSNTHQEQRISASKVPKWDDAAKKKSETVDEIKETVNKLKQMKEQECKNIQRLIQLDSASTSENNSDYFQIFYEKMGEVDESDRDDCLLEMLTLIEELKNN